ncbi:MAG TPA: helix-turn-helix domain-containing protein [Candidatus Pelethocola excrementipullorum]|nr:helix-turn-helix domain-containing protein [Candidatus Pelethocola excrementipullorum]
MAKYIELSADSPDKLCLVAKALSSPLRIDIIKLLYEQSCNVREIAEKLSIPASSAGLHVKVLEEAGLIITEQQPGERGSAKVCSRKGDLITIRLHSLDDKASNVKSFSMPVGAYMDCRIYPTCGIGSEFNLIGNEDKPEMFFLPERLEAQLLWTSAGYVEYRFPNIVPAGETVKRITISAEMCSEAPNYREDWKSDITVWINEVECGTWTSPGDYGNRRGRLTPDWVKEGNTQYGVLVNWSIEEDVNYVNGTKVSKSTLKNINLKDKPYITLRIGNKPDAKYVGGFNLFGKKAGDYAQDIVLTVEY